MCFESQQMKRCVVFFSVSGGVCCASGCFLLYVVLLRERGEGVKPELVKKHSHESYEVANCMVVGVSQFPTFFGILQQLEIGSSQV